MTGQRQRERFTNEEEAYARYVELSQSAFALDVRIEGLRA